jgi:hypothetical protein
VGLGHRYRHPDAHVGDLGDGKNRRDCVKKSRGA